MGVVVERNQYENPPPGLHAATCVDVYDFGIVETEFGKKRMVGIAWQIEALNQRGEPFVIWRRFSASLDKRASLRKTLEAWRGKPYRDDEISAIDLESLLGKPCQVLLVEQPGKDGGVFVNVSQVMPLGAGMMRVAPWSGYKRKVDRDTNAVPPEDRAPQPPDEDVPF